MIYKKHGNDGQSIQMWVVKNKNKVLFYKQYISVEVEGGLSKTCLSPLGYKWNS
jgi:hypothetical protein